MKQLIHGELKYDHLIGLEFDHGTRDCYEMLRNIFKYNLDIDLSPYARPDDWWIQGMNLYQENFHKEGFSVVDILPDMSNLRILDVPLIALPDARSPAKTVTNHCAIYVGNGKIIHHRPGKTSQEIRYAGLYKNCTTCVVRHKDVPDLAPRDFKTLDVMDYVLPHKRELIMRALNDRNPKDA
jgi:cell wall-associated NlpC family hydrolase